MTEGSPAAEGTSRRDLRLAVRLAVLAAAVLACLSRGHLDNMDSRIQFATAWNVVERGDASLRETEWEDHRYATRGTDGTPYMQYGPGTVLLHAPGILAGRAVAAATGLDAVRLSQWCVSFVTPVAAGLTLGLLFLLARRVGLARRDAFVVCALHGAATYALVYARSTYYETASAAALVAAVTLPLLAGGEESSSAAPVASRWSGRLLVLGGCAFAFAVSMKVANVVVAPALVAALWTRPASAFVRRTLLFLVPVCLVLALVAFLGWRRFGSPFETGYGRFAAFGTPLPEGLRRILLSGQAGWFVLSPALLLALPGLGTLFRARRSLAVCAAGAIGAMALLSATYSYPEGGTAYGARYLVPVTPFASLAAGMFLARSRGALRAAGFAVAALSALIQLPGLVLAHQDYWQVVEAHTPAERAALPPRPVVDARLAWEKVRGRDHPYDLSVLSVAPPGRTLDPVYPALPGLNVWWARAVRHDHRPAMLLALLPMLLAAALALRGLVRNAREP